MKIDQIKHKKIYRFNYFIIFFIFLPNLLFANNNFDSIFKKANNLYKRGEYQKALKSYKLIEDNNYKSASLYYNLGNSYAKLNKFGYAILYYEKSLFLNPNNNNAEYNLKLINKKNIDKIINESGKAEMAGVNEIYNFLRALSTSMLIYIFIFLWIFIWFVLIMKKFNKLKLNSYTFITILFSLIALFNFILIIGNYYSVNKVKLGVAVVSEINVIDGPDEEYKKIFKIHEGLKVQITDERENWYQITLPNGNIGWVKNSEVKEI